MKNWTLNRRTFLKQSSMAAACVSSASLLNASGDTGKTVRIGFVGVGRRGTSLVRTLLDIPGVELPAFCDIDEENLSRAQKVVEEAGRERPQGYSRGPEDYRRLVEREDLDAVITATPWNLHAPVMVATMKAGKYGATEVNAALTVDECWELVETSEQTGMPCMMLENVCYFRNVMMILNMIRQGALGELIHCEAGYQHDVRRGKFERDVPELRWRGEFATKHDGNLYPTHPIGPVAQWLDINRGDRFDYLVSMSSKSRGMNTYVEKAFSADHPNAKREYALGDVNVSLIKTYNGATVTLYHDTQLPRPYDLILRVQGTEGICMGYEEKIYLEDRSQKQHQWEPLDRYRDDYEHPVWQKHAGVAGRYGHGGADFLTLQAFVNAVRDQKQTPIDVYDSVIWSVIFPLSEQSVANRSRPVDFPDFTKGKWQHQLPIPIKGL